MPADQGGRVRVDRPPYLATGLALFAVVVGSRLLPAARLNFGGDVPPLYARLQPSIGFGMLVPVGLVALAWIGIPRLRRAPLWAFLSALVVFGWCFAVSLAAESGGMAAVIAPFGRTAEYWSSVPLVRTLGPRAFSEQLPHLTGRLTVHLATHPPGAALFLWVVSNMGGGSVVLAALVVALVGATGAVFAYWVAREPYGEQAGRAAAVLFTCCPGVLLYSATSMDAVFMTVTAAALAALVRSPRSNRWAFVSGLLAATALLFTFGAVMLGLVAAGVWVLAWPRTPRAALVRRVALCLAGLVCGTLLLRWVVGVDLVQSFRSALHADMLDRSRQRSYAYWVFGNVAAFLITAGIAQTALLVSETRARWRARRPGLETVLWAALLVSSLSGLILGEVDHVWLLFVPLLTAAAGAAAASCSLGVRGAAEVGLGQAVVEQALLYTFW